MSTSTATATAAAVSITTTLPGVALVDQLVEPTRDGQPDENARDNCLFACGASYLNALHHTSTYDGDAIKDAVMGQGYTGFGYFSQKLTAYLADNGVDIHAVPSTVANAHTFLTRGIGLLAVIPSAWNTQAGALSPSFSTHVVLLCGQGAAAQRAMNPWGGFWHDQTDAWWQSRYCYGALWALIPSGGAGGGLTTMAWHQQADKSGRDDHGHTCGQGMLNYLQAPGHEALLAADGLLSETYWRGGAFLPLERGEIVRGVKDPRDGSWHFDQNGAAVLVDVWTLLQAAQSAPTPTPTPTPTAVDPLAQKALDQMTALKALLGEL